MLRRMIQQQEAERKFFDSYRTLGRLQTFVWINAKGFQKIMKKYDKRNSLRGTGLELLPEFEKRLEKEARRAPRGRQPSAAAWSRRRRASHARLASDARVRCSGGL